LHITARLKEALIYVNNRLNQLGHRRLRFSMLAVFNRLARLKTPAHPYAGSSDERPPPGFIDARNHTTRCRVVKSQMP
jgi:hypothetical protein